MLKLTKDPSANLDYVVDWTSWLGADTIATSTWTVTTGATLGSTSYTTTTATAWLTGGTAGRTYTLTNQITTAGGRTDQRSFLIHVLDR